MPEENTGEGQALDAAVSFEPVESNEDPAAEADRVVEAAANKVEKQREHLAGAEAALEAAKVARASVGGI